MLLRYMVHVPHEGRFAVRTTFRFAVDLVPVDHGRCFGGIDPWQSTDCSKDCSTDAFNRFVQLFYATN